jgi:hypothetical protein
MNAYIIRVIIEEPFGRKIAEACVPMDSELRDAIQPLRLSDAALPFLDTSTAIVRRVKTTRQSYAAQLTPKIAKVLLDVMESRDLFNGYTKAEQQQFQAPQPKD